MIGEICSLPSNKFTKEGWKQQEDKIHNDKPIEGEANVIFPAFLDALETDKQKFYNKKNIFNSCSSTLIIQRIGQLNTFSVMNAPNYMQ